MIMAKRPSLGRVKTRLAASIGDGLALSLYEKMLSKTLHTASLSPYQVIISATGTGNYEFPSSVTLNEQVEGDLGLRMATAFQHSFEQFPSIPTVMIGTDCFELSLNGIEEAFKQLEQKDVVLGPSEDGGYYLIGMKTVHTEVFKEMQWSVDSVMEETRKRLHSAKLTFREVATLNDIDTLEDLKKSALYEEVKQQLNELK